VVWAPKGKLAENALTFSPGVIKTRARRSLASLATVREQDGEINALIDAAGTRTPSVAHQMIEIAAEPEIGRIVGDACLRVHLRVHTLGAHPSHRTATEAPIVANTGFRLAAND
jgi:hypothetical protein